MYAIGNNRDNQLDISGYSSNLAKVTESSINADGIKQIIGTKTQFFIFYDDGKVKIIGDGLSSLISFIGDIQMYSNSCGNSIQEVWLNEKIIQIEVGNGFILFLLENGRIVGNNDDGTKYLPLHGKARYIAAGGKYGTAMFSDGNICLFKLSNYWSSSFKVYPVEFSGNAAQIALSEDNLIVIDQSGNLYKSREKPPHCEELEGDYVYSGICQLSGCESHILALACDGDVYKLKT